MHPLWTRPPTVPVVRSWPAPGELCWRDSVTRPHVIDRLPRVEIAGHDYRPLRELVLAGALDSSHRFGVLVVEWDIAVSKEDLRSMRRRATDSPDVGFVAPYRLYPATRWAHGHGPGVPIKQGDPDCTYPCFGVIYLPRWLLEMWEPAPHDPRLTDTNFAAWSAARGLIWPVLWDVHAIHLHW